MVNAPILGAFARLSGLLSLESLLRSLPAFIPANLEGNKAAIREIYGSAEQVETASP
jgi:Pyruvate/2-oxoacid:ferredoxin oxidoreductase gamma subunit